MVSQFYFITSKPTTTGFSLKLIPRDSPESPLYPRNLTKLERIQRIIHFSKARAAYLDAVSFPNATFNTDSISLQLLRDGFFYMFQVGIGNPPLNVFLLMDTGGGLIWTQCQPCQNCYIQRFPIYYLAASSSYHQLPCDHPRSLSSYGGGSKTKGIASLESFTFANSRVVDNMIFGCSNDNQNIQFAQPGDGGAISGIMGLGFSPDSLVSQLSTEIKKQFSYCLVPFTEAMTAPSVVRFGIDIPRPPGNLQTTRFITPPPPPPGSFYYQLNLIDISVSPCRLGFSQDLFRIREDGTGGVPAPSILDQPFKQHPSFRRIPGGSTIGLFIDSGVPITRIAQHTNGVDAYDVVMRAFEEYYDSKHLHRRGRRGAFRSCYNKQPGFDAFPTLTYHFQGADYVVDGKNVDFNYNYEGFFCVGIVPGAGVSILGAVHMQSMRIIHDGNIGAVQFYPENCADEHL
ncbi:hypothetical protein LWI29_021362 [Acer saccharum]|uniref:Peptidase A1 domain-containing protein n=1 Tax=Acer saccharum TaxID=4024 RepID=A0AA39SZA9_ACESA|nr:hypothetical protein LWI29_021362 [Acer saccharum]